MVIGDLGLCCRQRGEQRAFPDVGIADQAHVGDCFQLQPDIHGLGFNARFGEIGRLPGRRGEARVSVPAAAAVEDHLRLPCGRAYPR